MLDKIFPDRRQKKPFTSKISGLNSMSILLKEMGMKDYSGPF